MDYKKFSTYIFSTKAKVKISKNVERLAKKECKLLLRLQKDWLELTIYVEKTIEEELCAGSDI